MATLSTIEGQAKGNPNPRKGLFQRQKWLVAWFWITPALLFLALFLLYPLISTIIFSFYDRHSTNFVGLDNYKTIFTNPAMIDIVRNNLIWIVLATTGTIVLGAVIAALVDRVKLESFIKSTIFLPMAISFVGAGVIWKFIYTFKPEGETQIGLLNAILAFFHFPPQSWLTEDKFATFALIAVYIWMWTGFCVVIFSAALKSIPEDVIEAARIDGASGIQIFFRITLPMIRPTIAVVTTTMIINILKIFDIVYVMTAGNYRTDVIAVEYVTQLFLHDDYGLASALACLLLVVMVPLIYVNIRRYQQEGRK